MNTPRDWRTFDLDADPEFIEEFQKVVNNPSTPDADLAYKGEVNQDSYIGMRVAIPTTPGEAPRTGRVTKRMRAESGLPVGTANNNPILDT